MRNYERTITDKNGNDTGVRENYRGDMYINHKVFFSDSKVRHLIARLAKSNIVKQGKPAK